MNIYFSSTTLPNSRGFKPNEDVIVCDNENKIAIICDGVTQKHDEYEVGSKTSEARKVSEIFATELHKSLLVGSTFEEAVSIANSTVKLHNLHAKNAYPPALVFVCAQIKGSKLEYAYVGDSLIYLLRNNVRICLAEQQTAALAFFKRSNPISKDEVYNTIANNPDHPLGYGVITGNPSALNFLRHTQLELLSGDRVILASDGLDKYLRFTHPEVICSKSVDDIVEFSKVYDVPPYATYADDKSIIVIDIK